MRSGFLLSVRFWVATWIVILFIGLTPLPPVAELVIVVGFVVHGVWFGSLATERQEKDPWIARG